MRKRYFKEAELLRSGLFTSGPFRGLRGDSNTYEKQAGIRN
ncbi:hypothetical protein [Spirosoma sp. KNUC1025]